MAWGSTHCPSPALALGVEGAAVQRDDLATDRQAEPAASQRLRLA
jgi:hypothetical protein